MTEELINASEVIGGLQSMVSTQISPLITVFKAIGIAILVYILFLVIKGIFSWRAATKLSKISDNVGEINKKLDLIAEKIHLEKNKKIKSKKID